MAWVIPVGTRVYFPWRYWKHCPNTLANRTGVIIDPRYPKVWAHYILLESGLIKGIDSDEVKYCEFTLHTPLGSSFKLRAARAHCG